MRVLQRNDIAAARRLVSHHAQAYRETANPVHVWRRRVGVPGALRHDFRRTAGRNMVNRGVPERVAMKISGHRTRAVFDRYHIVSPGDLQDAARRIAGTFSGTSPSATMDAQLVTP